MSDEADRSAAESLRAERDTSRRGFLAGVAGAVVTASPVPSAAVAATGAGKGAGNGGGDANPRLFTFVGGKAGRWRVTESKAVVGEPLPTAGRADILNAAAPARPPVAMAVRGRPWSTSDETGR